MKNLERLKLSTKIIKNEKVVISSGFGITGLRLQQ